jgi:hypothetical protein
VLIESNPILQTRLLSLPYDRFLICGAAAPAQAH